LRAFLVNIESGIVLDVVKVVTLKQDKCYRMVVSRIECSGVRGPTSRKEVFLFLVNKKILLKINNVLRSQHYSVLQYSSKRLLTTIL